MSDNVYCATPISYVCYHCHMATNLAKTVERIKPTHSVIRQLNGKKYKVHYYNDTELREAGFTLFGYTYKGKIYIRNGLPARLERALFRHEVYHVEDKCKWLGKYGMEIRANIHTLLHDPLGFLAQLVYSLNLARIKTYCRLYIYPHS